MVENYFAMDDCAVQICLQGPAVEVRPGMQQAEGEEEAHDVKACSAAAAGAAWKKLWSKLTRVLFLGAEVAATAGIYMESADLLTQFGQAKVKLVLKLSTYQMTMLYSRGDTDVPGSKLKVMLSICWKRRHSRVWAAFSVLCASCSTRAYDSSRAVAGAEESLLESTCM